MDQAQSHSYFRFVILLMAIGIDSLFRFEIAPDDSRTAANVL